MTKLIVFATVIVVLITGIKMVQNFELQVEKEQKMIDRIYGR